MELHESDGPRGSLAARLLAVARRDWLVAAAVAALIAAGPLATIAGAHLLAAAARAEASRLEAQGAPKRAARDAAERDRRTLGALLRRPPLGATLEAFARALPADARLAAAGRGRDGRLEAEVATPDPDVLRAALRRDPALAGLRDAGQRAGEAEMLVSLREPPR